MEKREALACVHVRLESGSSVLQTGKRQRLLYWLLGISVLKPGNKQSCRRPSPHLSDV